MRRVTELPALGTLGALFLAFGLLVGFIAGLIVGAEPEPEKDACRAEIEQAREAYDADQMDLARDLLLDAVGATCLSEVK